MLDVCPFLTLIKVLLVGAERIIEVFSCNSEVAFLSQVNWDSSSFKVRVVLVGYFYYLDPFLVNLIYNNIISTNIKILFIINLIFNF